MTKNDSVEFAQQIAVLAEAFNEEPSDSKIEIYFRALSAYSINEIKAATLKLLQSCKFFPKIAEFIEVLEGTGDERAQQAWYSLLSALNEIGADKTVDLQDPFAHQTAIDLQLWGIGIEEKGYPDQRLTGTTAPESHADGVYYVAERTDQTPFLRAEFLKRYKFHSKHSDIRTLPTKLIGLNVIQQRRNMELYSHNWTSAAIAKAEQMIAAELTMPLTLESFRAERKAIAAKVRKQLDTPKQKAIDAPPISKEEAEEMTRAFSQSLKRIS